ncbi:acylphosphatase, partial [Methanophagales archaeon]
EIARRLGIKGFVENIKPYDIRIVTEGEDEAISEFIERIKIKRFPIDVESVRVSFEDFKGEFEYFEIKRGDWQEELGERLDTAGKLLYRSVELGERSVELGERAVELSERAVELSERSVELGEESVSIGKRMLEKQDETITEIKGLREDLKSYLEERFDRLEHEVMAIKAKLGMV